MTGSPEEQRVLAEIEQHLMDEDPRLAARMQDYSARMSGGRRTRKRSRKAVIIIAISWLLLATIIATLLVLALRLPAAAFP